MDWQEVNRESLMDRLRNINDNLERNPWITNRFNDISSSLERFMMVHTFSHLLIRQLSYECGYASASIREKIYVFQDKAGLLIYTQLMVIRKVR